eukprot:TRINITY_DN5785_c0_g2_i5.p9 TRINITY_DN5785_c0_g2~~TRINITY_DN5785_c0_g2_i5.p9  ORF type:complete len:120 (-),score=0.81 TRINITY_DN5785_c0_g2_i5:82-441(-)
MTTELCTRRFLQVDIIVICFFNIGSFVLCLYLSVFCLILKCPNFRVGVEVIRQSMMMLQLIDKQYQIFTILLTTNYIQGKLCGMNYLICCVTYWQQVDWLINFLESGGMLIVAVVFVQQ